MTEIKQTANPPRKRSKKSTHGPAVGDLTSPIQDSDAELAPQSGPEDAPLAGEFVGNEAESDQEFQGSTQAMVSVAVEFEPEDEKVVERVEHLNRGIGWTLISAGVIGMVMPGVLGTPFLILGAMALWPGNRTRVERWRQGHSPKVFHGAMKQINRFLDDLDKRYPRIDRQ